MVMTVVFAGERRQAAERFVRERGWEGISAEQVLEMPSIFIGSVGHRRNSLRARDGHLRHLAAAVQLTSAQLR
jgi:hypothetical protein